MGETRIDASVASDLANAFTDFSVPEYTFDSASDQDVTRWQDTEFKQNMGYYNDIPELAAVDDAKATWTIGKGFKADEETTMLLDTIKGNGFDTFNTILENMARVKEIGGNAYAEIIRDDEDNLLNVKPLDPARMVHLVNREGIIVAFEQTSTIQGNANKRIETKDIFYLARNRVGDEMHGQAMTPRLANIILMRNEAMEDWKRVLHHNIDPMIAYKLDTDDPVEIAAFKAKVDAAKGKGENMYLTKDSVEFEIISLAPNANLNPLAWIENLNQYFYEAAQVPKIIVGGTGGFTEAAVKIAYLAFQQTIEEEQLFMEEQVLSQLNLVIELEFPASLEADLLSDEAKDEPTDQAAQPNDTEATTEGQT